MSWPSTDFELEIQVEIDALRDVAKAVGLYLQAIHHADENQANERFKILGAHYRAWKAGPKAEI